MSNSNFDCQNMPTDIKALFFDSYRQPNNTTVTVYVAEEREPIKNWLVENGANVEDDVTISYYWVDEDTSVEKFNFDGEVDDDDDEDEGEEDAPIAKKPKKIRARVETSEDSAEEVFDIAKIAKEENILEFEDEE